MKVKKLIELLSKYNPELEVLAQVGWGYGAVTVVDDQYDLYIDELYPIGKTPKLVCLYTEQMSKSQDYKENN